MLRRYLLVVVVLAGFFAVALSPATAATPYCGIRWGSLAKSSSQMSAAPIIGVRAGQHPCFDRIVIDVDGRAAGYRVAYVDRVREDGSGRVVPLRGGAALQVIARAPAYNARGNATFVPANRREVVGVSGFRTFRQVAWAGSFEGQTTLGVGVRARLPFRVFTLQGPGSRTRLVIDVAHRW